MTERKCTTSWGPNNDPSMLGKNCIAHRVFEIKGGCVGREILLKDEDGYSLRTGVLWHDKNLIYVPCSDTTTPLKKVPFSELFLDHWSNDVWDPYRMIPKGEVIPLSDWEESEEDYPRAGGDNWTPTTREVLVIDFENMTYTLAIESSEWHGGINSGGPYYDYYPIEKKDS